MITRKLSSRLRHKRFKQIALRLINRKGFKAMTMRDLAQEMGCDVSNIYNYTSSKSALLEDLLLGISEALHRGLDDIMSAQIDSIAKISALLRLHIQITVERPYEVALVINEWRHLQPSSKEEYISLRALFEKKVEILVRAGVDEGAFRDVDVRIIAGAILGTVRWIYNTYTQEGNTMNALDLHSELSRFVIEGLLVRNLPKSQSIDVY